MQILIAGVLNGHIAGKAIYLRIFAGTEHIHNRSFIGVGSWIGIAVALWLLAWIIASAIPVFNNLLSLMVRLFRFGNRGIYHRAVANIKL